MQYNVNERKNQMKKTSLEQIEKDLIATHHKLPDSPENNDKWIEITTDQPELEIKVYLFHLVSGAGTGHLYIHTLTSFEGVKPPPKLYWQFQAKGSKIRFHIPFTHAVITHWMPI